MRQIGAPLFAHYGAVPAVEGWPSGIFEVVMRPQRLVLRDSLSAPDKGELMSLYRPELTHVTQQNWLRFRGIEALDRHGEPTAAHLQEWLVDFMR